MVASRAATATLRVATRGSALALWQAEHTRARLAADAETMSELVVVRTTGDRVQDTPLSAIGDRGLFTREVDDTLLGHRADLAVHSAKDIPTSLPDGLEIVAFLEREDPADVLVAAPNAGHALRDLHPGARVGTSSLRRRAQLAALRPDLSVVDLRGNVDTRLARVRDGVVDAAILARAGLVRLQRDADATEVLAPPGWLPAVGQGALALVMRTGDALRERVATLDHPPTRAAIAAERAFLRRLEGGCQVPIGALARLDGAELVLHGGVFALDGSEHVRDELRGKAQHAEELGIELAERLLGRGADRILARIRAAAPTRVPEVPEP